MTAPSYVRAAIASALAFATRIASADPLVSFDRVPTVVRLGIDHAVELVLHAPGAGTSPPAVLASVGTVSDVRATGPDTFTVRYEPPPGGPPDVAVLLARCVTCGAGAVAVMPLAGRYHLDVRAEPHSHVTVRAGEVLYEESVAGHHRTLDISVHIPPGRQSLEISAVDEAGNQRDHVTPLELPDTHRVLVVPDGIRRYGRPMARWRLAAANADGTPALSPPEVAVAGGPWDVRRVAPGLFLIEARAPRGSSGTLTLRVREPGVQLVSPPEAITLPPPARLRVAGLGERVAVAAGSSSELPFAIFAPDGERLARMAEQFAVELPPGVTGTVRETSDGYVLAVQAATSLSTGPYSLRVIGLDVPIFTGTFDTVPDVPARLVTVGEPSVAVDEIREVTVAMNDRFGHRARVRDARVTVRPGRVIGVRTDDDGVLHVTLISYASTFSLGVRDASGAADSIDLPATPRLPPLLDLAALGVVRATLALPVYAGARIEAAVHVPRESVVSFAGSASIGGETATVHDDLGNSVQIVMVPVTVRGGVMARTGRFAVGPMVGAVAWPVLARVEHAQGLTRVTDLAFGITGVLRMQVETRWGIGVAEIGGESGAIDTVAVRGTLGGLYGALGWGIGF